MRQKLLALLVELLDEAENAGYRQALCFFNRNQEVIQFRTGEVYFRHPVNPNPWKKK